MGRTSKISKKNIAFIIISILGIVVFVSVLFSLPSITVYRQHEQANVVLFSKGEDTSLITSLKIDKEAINLTVITQSNLASLFDENLLKYTNVIIIDRYMPSNSSDLHLLRSYINGTNGRLGLIFFGGIKNDLTLPDDFNDDQINMISPLLPATISPSFTLSSDNKGDDDYKIQIAMNTAVETQLKNDPENANILVKHIAWTSCPLISKRMLIPSNDIKATATNIIKSIDEKYSILSEWTISSGGGTVIMFSLLINGYNDPFVLWPYFNYLMYVSVFHTKADFSDNSIESFAEWPYSPIPHLIEIIMWFSMIGVLWVITIYWFLKFRKRKIPNRTTEEKPSPQEIT